MSVKITTYWIRHGLSCANILPIINKEGTGDTLEELGFKDSKGELAPDSLLSNLGVKQSDLIYENNKLQRIFLSSDMLCCSVLSRSIETAVLIFNKNEDEIYPIPYISEERRSLLEINKKYIPFADKKNGKYKAFLTLGKNKDNEPKISSSEKYEFLKEQFSYNKDFWTTVINKSREKTFTRKLPRINWSLIDEHIGDKTAISPNKKKFFKKIIPELIKISDKKKLKKSIKDRSYTFVFVSHEKFIKSLIKPFKKYKSVRGEVGHTHVYKITYTYNLRDKKENILDVTKIYPTKENMQGLSRSRDGEYSFSFMEDKIPLNYDRLHITHMSNDVVDRCPSKDKFVKKINKAKTMYEKDKQKVKTTKAFYSFW